MGLESGRRCWGVGRPARSPSALLPPGACAPRHPSCPRRPWACGCRFSRRSLPTWSTFEVLTILSPGRTFTVAIRYDFCFNSGRSKRREAALRLRVGGTRVSRTDVIPGGVVAGGALDARLLRRSGSGAGSAARTFSRTGRWPGKEHEPSCWGRLGVEIGTRTFSPAEWWPAGHSMPRCLAEPARARKRNADVFTAREVVGRGVSRGPRRVDGDATRTFSRTLRRACYPSRSPDRKGAG